MKKIGIVTIIDNNNYGNRLQNYAVQEIIKKYDLYPVTLLNSQCSNDKKFFLLKIIKKKILNIKKVKVNPKRSENFSRFNRNITFSTSTIYPFTKKLDYSYYITGSDQVWNPNIGRMKDVDLLSFAPNNKKIAFSASFGIDKINMLQTKKLKKRIKNYKAISVREESGKAIIKNVMPDIDVKCLVDPTMMLKIEEWDKVTKKPPMLKCKKYILIYFLGNLDPEINNRIELFAKKNNCYIIDILDKESPFYTCGPSEFLYLEKNAFLICTDSFHSSVFAILNKVPFIVFERYTNTGSMNSRINTLLSKFKLEDRKYNGKEITRELLNCDYTEAYKILEKERKKSEDFLKKALDIE